MSYDVTPDEAFLAGRAETIAGEILADAVRRESARERRRREMIGRVASAREGRDMLIDMSDQVLRVPSRRRAAVLLSRLVAEHGAAKLFGSWNGAALDLAGRLAPHAPSLVMPLVEARLRREFASVVLPAERAPLARHIARRRRQGISLNVNLLGEAVLGEEEAARRTAQICELLARDEIDYVSVKISAICSRLDVLAYEHSLARICDRLRVVLEAASAGEVAKFVNLDMEEYRDLALTIDAFTSVLAEPKFAALDAGIVLQAYLPDSHDALARLAAFARSRHQSHGSVVKVRIVKGANLAMERVEAELREWPQAPYTSKQEVDASYKRLLRAALSHENSGALRVGVASHNLFDVGYALALHEVEGSDVEVGIEMLEGMANAQALAVRERAGSLLLYTPVVRRDDFASAVAYLVRRFDENTAPENFLAHLFELAPGSRQWSVEDARFRSALEDAGALDTAPRRAQDRSLEIGEARESLPPASFRNVADTDFTSAANRRWVMGHLEALRREPVDVVAAIVGGKEILEPLTGEGIDPSRPSGVSYRYVQADLELVEQAVSVARRAAESWRSTTAAHRREILAAVAGEMERQRGRSIAAMVRDGGKVVGEADPEVSEAIDFANYYGESALQLDRSGATFDPCRVTVVAPPWNFPYSIPSGGVLAALAAGSAVILKPAPETVLVASLIVRQCLAAGVPEGVVQFLPCPDDEVGRRLVSHEDVDAVVLTGSLETARLFYSFKPEIELHAETSGKNALVVTDSADVDDAIRDLVHSAFSSSGQKCSAASLALVQASLYDDAAFRARLADAVRSLRVGPSDDLSTELGPLIRPPEGRLLSFLTTLSGDESWLVQPAQVRGNPHLWSPGVVLGVAPGSDLHLYECFGPVLGLMRYETIDEAIELQNATAFGLTGGIHALDSEQVSRWCDRVEVGNAYVNRHTTGAIVRRQPFGGWKGSCVGRRAKAGGPNYVASLGSYLETATTDLVASLEAFCHAWPELVAGRDESGLASEANVFRLRPIDRVAVRVEERVDVRMLRFSLEVAAIVGSAVELSFDPGSCAENGALGAGAHVEVIVEKEGEWRERLAALRPARVRVLGPLPAPMADLLDCAGEVVTEPIQPEAFRESLNYAREQAIAWSRHRHGNVRAIPLDAATS